MKRLIIILLLGAVFMQCSPKINKKNTANVDFRSIVPSPKPAPAIKFGRYKSFAITNGLRVIVVNNKKVPTVSVRLFLDRKPISEGDKAGYIELTGEMLSRGSKTRTKAQLDEDIDYLGANFSTFSKGFYLSGLSRNVDKMMEIASDAILNPAFSKEEFDKIKKQKLSGLAAEKEDPNSISSNVCNALNYGKSHPFGEMVTEKTINNVTLDDCKKYYNDYFSPELGYLVFVGDIDAKKARELAFKYFGKWKNVGKTIKPLPNVLFPSKTSVGFVPKTGAVQSVVAITYPVKLTPNSPDLIKARVLNTIIGGFFRSRLNQNLREDHAYTYGIRSSLRDNMNIGEFTARASVRNEVTDSAIAQIMYELNRIRTEKVPEEELELVKSVMAGKFGRALEGPNAIANFALKTERFKLPKNFYKDYLKNLEKVTVDDIYNMAQKYIKPNNANIVVVGDKSVADKLKKFGKVNFYDIYGNKVKMTKPMGSDISLKELFAENIKALGGQKAVDKVKSLETEYIAKMQGMELKLWEMKVNGEKYAMKMDMMGRTMQSETYNGKNGIKTANGQSMPMSEDDMKESKEASLVFPVLALASNKNAKLKGVESIEGKDYYIVEVKNGDKTELYYFNKKNFLLERHDIIMSVNGKTQKISFKITDYKDHDGVLISEKNTMSGAMPMPIEFNLTKAVVNGKIDEIIFKID